MTASQRERAAAPIAAHLLCSRRARPAVAAVHVPIAHQPHAGVELNAQRVFAEALATNAAIPIANFGSGSPVVWAQRQPAMMIMIIIAMVLEMVAWDVQPHAPPAPLPPRA